MNTTLFSLALFAAAFTAQAVACLPYEPAQVFLHGELIRKTYPGPPNFESVADGDEAETGFYLRLDVPACTLDGKDDSDNVAQKNVRLVQLVLDKKGYDHWRPELGKTVTVKGTLFSPFTGHHHADLLMTVAPPDVQSASSVPQ
jgi:hypothetical protein